MGDKNNSGPTIAEALAAFAKDYTPVGRYFIRGVNGSWIEVGRCTAVCTKTLLGEGDAVLVIESNIYSSGVAAGVR